MINIRGLRKSYGTRKVLDSLTAEVSEGTIVGVLGGSGSGKSTLLRCLDALEPFESGSIEIAGHRLEPGPLRGADALHGDVGMVFQDYQLFPHLSVLDNVTLAPRVVRSLERSAAELLGREWLERVGLGDRAASRPHQLSGGQKQRVALARTLAQGVRVLLLDEPTSALDPAMRREVQAVLSQLVKASPQRLTLLLVTHDLELVKELVDELWLLADGALVERGSPQTLLHSEHSPWLDNYFRKLSTN